MPGLPFVLADRDRIEQFNLLTRTRQLFRHAEIWNELEDDTWARRRIGEHCFAVSLLGPGWVFDDYAREARAEELAARSAALTRAGAEDRRGQMHSIIDGLQLGPIAERVLWAVHQRVIQAKSSVVRIPDSLLAEAVWGQGNAAWPRHWRTSLNTSLRSLGWLHLAAWPQDGPPLLGDHSALITHSADLRTSENDGCDDDCPLLAGPPHKHFNVNIGRGFLGILERFAQADDTPGVRTYDFKLFGPKGSGPTLRTVGKSGKVTTIYLPAKLGEPAVCKMFTAKQHELLQAIVRETSRQTKGRRREISQAEVFTGNQIPGIQRRNNIVCALLAPDAKYVGFNGSRKLKGLGYGLTTPGGWLIKAGYALDDLTGFFADLAALADPLGLIAVGIHVPTRECFGLAQLQALAGTPSGRQTLAHTHLRIYALANYVQRWNDYFGWAALSAVQGATDLCAALIAEMTRKGITKAALARGIDTNRSFLSKVFSGKKPWPATLLSRVQAWVAAYVRPDAGEQTEVHGTDVENRTEPAAVPLLLPLLAALDTGAGAMLDVALAYRRRGWSVVPQNPGEKQPCVKWKPYQDRLPTETELASWFAQWPEAGLAVVLGPVSGLLVIDVDGTEAHAALIERLGSEPVAPKAISGSHEPDRYHLFFRCPEIDTKAKVTPWHPKLEFRAKGGIVVIPPSLHSSGHRYAWAEGRSPDSLLLPELPPLIVEALQARRASPSPAPVTGDVDLENASVSTQDFLAGKYADGPNWNERLFRAACDLAGRGMSREEAEPLLLSGARPWDETNAETARQTIASAFSQVREPARY